MYNVKMMTVLLCSDPLFMLIAEDYISSSRNKDVSKQGVCVCVCGGGGGGEERRGGVIL